MSAAADARFHALRASGYAGPIDQDGHKVDDLAAWIARQTGAGTVSTPTKIDREILSASELHKWSDDLRKLLLGIHDDILVVTSELRIALPNMVDDNGNLIFTGAQGKINARRIIRPANHAAALTYDGAKSALSTWTTFQRVVLGELGKNQPRGKAFHATQ